MRNLAENSIQIILAQPDRDGNAPGFQVVEGGTIHWFIRANNPAVAASRAYSAAGVMTSLNRHPP